MCAPSDVRVVILGQDPYHTPGVADGLAFSSFIGNPLPPSLLNIYKEIELEFGSANERTPELSKWAEQGVLLLNATLTVESGKANSHVDFGWHEFTDAVIKKVSSDAEGIVFLLWGRYAQAKESLIDASKHFILKAAHPSPLARGAFFGCKHFSQTNELLEKTGKEPVNWSVA